jgi:dTDP-4-dehydrorhamnose 3,5-epimerase
MSLTRESNYMEFEKLAIDGAWIGHSAVHTDERGIFREWFKANDLEVISGTKFNVAQANLSVSHEGVLRGIHYSNAPSGQGKWITCVSGAIWDVVVDLRPKSETYKKWIGLSLTGSSGDALYISEGLGHAFLTLRDNSIVSYLLTSAYSPQDEYEINPFDPDINIAWPISNPRMSPKDGTAPNLATRFEQGNLPC